MFIVMLFSLPVLSKCLSAYQEAGKIFHKAFKEAEKKDVDSQ